MEQNGVWANSKAIQEKRETLRNLVCRDRNGSLGSEINILRKEINELLDSEEIKWHQRSKVQWLGLGGRNTKYFHTRASDRRRKNTISCIMDENGNWHDSIDGIVEVAVSYFKNIYSSSYLTRISEVLDTIPTKVTEEMNQLLIQEFTREEVEIALNQMHPTKAPSPDTNSQECQNLIDILQLYEAASGQKINADKSSVFFSNNTPDDRRNEVLNMLGPMQDTYHKKYLGLPSIIGKSKVEIFAEIKERVERKLSGWKEKMLSTLNDIANDRNNFQLVGHPLETRVVTRGRDQTHSFVTEEEVIGREGDKKAIIDLLLDFDVEENVSFISIVGIGGLGKTTLAQYVYNDEKVKTYFELKMWVCVSDIFELKIIFEKIIASAIDKKPENFEMDQLQNKLRQNLNQKKYLLILDDVWNEDKESWCELKRLLMGGAKGSKVVVTTRTKLVAKITSTISPYFLEGLSKSQSWLLLKQMAFKKEQETVDPNLEAIGMEIVENCQGVPLAIKTIGRVLYFKNTKDEWSYIKNNELTNVTQSKNGVLPVLKLSYDHLPSHLRCCFAYCSLFPKDYLIDKLTLIQLWIAQGFIQSPEENLQLEDVANEYFMDLIWRSFFQEAEEDEGMNMKFKVHDLIHDLAQLVSRIECALVDSNAKNCQ
ncbi:putative disease resistance protein RGA3 [Quercus lobata]|uniref:putative disease resistance protein RGA3 n=1 Tax=Quercus lobata TaxID=97700 RepID=UPI00124486F7|nr:putative disease resistance protein RGA3 [Quercus lobata]